MISRTGLVRLIISALISVQFFDIDAAFGGARGKSLCAQPELEVIASALLSEKSRPVVGGEKIHVQWPGLKYERATCIYFSRNFYFTRSMAELAPESSRVVVQKLYYDGVAAFVEIKYLPRESYGGFLLRKDRVWGVTDGNTYSQ